VFNVKYFPYYCVLILSASIPFAQAQYNTPKNITDDSSPNKSYVTADKSADEKKESSPVAPEQPSQSDKKKSSTPSSSNPPSEINFDVDALRALGYGAEVADYFKKGSQFLPGQHDLTLVVNGSARYSATVLVGEQGQLCMTPALQRKLKLRDKPVTLECSDLPALYPGAQIISHPSNSTIDILVAESDFDPLLRGDELSYGGFALLNNYRIYGMQISGVDNQHFYQGQFESGVNWQNWILRNNSSFSSGKNSTQYQFNETTLARSIASWRSLMQLGQINTQGSMFGGTPLNGVQLYSDSALQNVNKLVVPIVGVAQTPATVEVMQNGRLLYRTLVPAGPFELDRLNGVVSGQPLQVTVLQEDGQRQQFNVVTSQQVNDNIMREPSYQIAVGQYRERSGNDVDNRPLIANIEGSVRYNSTDYLAGLQFANIYQSVGGKLARQWDGLLPVSGSIGGQYSRNKDKDGQQWDTSVGTSLGAFSFGLSNLYRTRNYPTLYETVQKKSPDVQYQDDNSSLWFQDSETQMSNSASVSWGDPLLGRFSYTISNNHYYGNKGDTVLHSFNYGKKIKKVSLSLSYQGGNDRDNRFFLNLSIPLGRDASLSTQMLRYQDDTSLTTTFNHRPSNLLGYSIGASRSADTKRINGSVNATTAYSQLSTSGSWNDDNNHSAMLSASGALAYSDGLFATSPVTLGDTFGLLRVPGQSGVQVNTIGGGTTVTNHFGIAAIPTLPINRKTTVQLNTKNLPLNVRLDTTSFDVAVARGTIVTRDISATVMTQLLLGITLKDGSMAPSGSSVVDQKGQLIGVVMGGGNVMLSNEQIGLPIRLRMANQDECIVNYPVPPKFDPNMLYEEVSAICQ